MADSAEVEHVIAAHERPGRLFEAAGLGAWTGAVAGFIAEHARAAGGAGT